MQLQRYSIFYTLHAIFGFETPAESIHLIVPGYRRNEDRIISDSLFTREDIDEMDNSLEDVEEEDIIEDVD